MRTVLNGVVLFLAAGVLVAAHHGLAAFDQTTKVTLTGTVTAFRFVNPHVVVEFDVKDGGAAVHVRSAGVPPQMFRDDIGVVVEGTMTRAGVFESRRLMVSHNNEYQAPKAGHPVDEAELQKLMRTAKGTE